MKKLFTKRVRLVVYVQQEQMEALIKLAGGKGKVGSYVRQLIGLDVFTDRILANLPKMPIPRMGSPMRPKLAGEPPKRLAKATCTHGKSRGENCWQCGGMARIE